MIPHNGDDEGLLLVPGAYEVKEKAGMLRGAPHVSEIVNDQEVDAGQSGQQ
jgi:hypothetical protein